MNKTLTAEFLKPYMHKQPNWGFNGLGYVVYKRTYARQIEGRTEEWWETVKRCIEGAQSIGAKYTKPEMERLYDYVFNLKCNFSGRSLWQLGTGTVEKLGGNSLINCFYCSVEKLEDFCFIFENLMLGAGVGFSVRREHIHSLPKIKEDVNIQHQSTKDADFIVPDSRQGWVKLLREVLQSYFLTGKGFSYSTILIRSAGEPIKTFGGTASGPKILVDGIAQICDVLKSREGKKLRSLEVLDICNIIASIVVSGNVRRSSQLAIGDSDDYLFLRAKRWDLGTIPNWRTMSNNTTAADKFGYISDDVWAGFDGNGEAYGLFNLPLSQSHGRLLDGPMRHSNMYPADKDPCEGTNPCGEISLSSYASCNLAELYLNNIESKKELIDCAKLLYKTQKAIAALNYLHDETNKVTHTEFRLGLGITGICQAGPKLDWLNECYKELRSFDKEWSKEQGYPRSLKLTTCKPSGTLSLLSGSSPGVHPAYAKYYIRRVRMSSTDKLIPYCKSLGLKTEYLLNLDKTVDHKTTVVEFPCCAGEDVLLAKDMTAIQQLELLKRIQTEWSDNAVSCTVYYKREELPAIKAWLKEHYENSVKSVSFLLHADHGFQQAPYQEIDQATYAQLVKNVKPVNPMDFGSGVLESMECASGACPIK